MWKIDDRNTHTNTKNSPFLPPPLLQLHTDSLSHMCTNTPWISAQSDLISLPSVFCTSAFDPWCAMHRINYVSRLSTNMANTSKFLTGAGSSQRPRGWLQEAHACTSLLGYPAHEGKCKACIWATTPPPRFNLCQRKDIFHPPETCSCESVKREDERTRWMWLELGINWQHRYATKNNNRGMI